MTRHIIDYMAGRISSYEYILRVRRDALHAISRAESNGDNWVAETSRRMSAESERDQWKRLALDMGEALRVSTNDLEACVQDYPELAGAYVDGRLYENRALLARLDGIAGKDKTT